MRLEPDIKGLNFIAAIYSLYNLGKLLRFSEPQDFLSERNMPSSKH